MTLTLPSIPPTHHFPLNCSLNHPITVSRHSGGEPLPGAEHVLFPLGAAQVVIGGVNFGRVAGRVLEAHGNISLYCFSQRLRIYYETLKSFYYSGFHIIKNLFELRPLVSLRWAFLPSRVEIGVENHLLLKKEGSAKSRKPFSLNGRGDWI